MFAALSASPGFETTATGAATGPSTTETASATPVSVSSTFTPPTPTPGIGAKTGFDAKMSDTTMNGSGSLRAAMKAVGTCGVVSGSILFAIGSPGSSTAVFTAGVSEPVTKVCPDIEPVVDRRSLTPTITSMWAWGNPVAARDDARGLGEPAMAPAALAAFATRRQLSDVRLSVPFASNEGAAISQWVADSVGTLHSSGQRVSALGGDPGWVANPDLAVQWMTAAHSVAPFDGIQLDVEPWTTNPNWTTDPAAVAQYIQLVRQAQASAHGLGMTFGLDAPWWLATTPYQSGTALEALLPYVDSVSIVSYSDHADGMDGIIAQAWTAVTQTVAAHLPFSIGVQTSSNEIAGGAQYTFADRGSTALDEECLKVRSAYQSAPGYAGVTIEEYLSWATLKP